MEDLLYHFSFSFFFSFRAVQLHWGARVLPEQGLLWGGFQESRYCHDSPVKVQYEQYTASCLLQLWPRTVIFTLLTSSAAHRGLIRAVVCSCLCMFLCMYHHCGWFLWWNFNSCERGRASENESAMSRLFTHVKCVCAEREMEGAD